MSTSTAKRRAEVSVEEFILMLRAKEIRPASLEDVHGTHHQRKLYKHPNTGQYYVAIERRMAQKKG